MRTIEVLEAAVKAARHLGYQVRQEWLSGQGGGCCVLRGQKVLFIDLALDPAEQLAQVAAALGPELAAANNPQLLRLHSLMTERRQAA